MEADTAPTTTQELLARIRQGGLDRWEDLWRRFEVRIAVCVAARLGPELRSEVDPEDVVQEVFLRAWRRLDDFQPGRPFYPWLAGIASNVVGDLLRKARAARRCGRGELRLDETGAPRRDPPAGGTTPTEAARRNETARRIQGRIEKLPASWREAVLLVFYEGLDRREAAERLGITRENLQMRLHRALRRLRQLRVEESG